MPPFASSDDQTPEGRAAKSLPAAILLAFTGGALDAFVYLNHGHVFAAAMTGNGVLFGVAILHHDWPQSLRHLFPILGFVLGVFAAKLLDSKLRCHAVTVGLLCEITILFGFSWLPGSFPDMVFVPLLAIVAAYQVSSFRTADTYAYNSTFMTGNLRTAMDGLYDTLTPSKRAAGLLKFREFSLIVASFMFGAASGAILSPHLLNHTLWLIDLPLCCVLLLALRSNRPTSVIAT
jgi:uncharacterized membrane protein YoaK (UPF0700 family)